MTHEQQTANASTWAFVAADIDQHPESPYWTPWKVLAHRFLDRCAEAGLPQFFRAGQSMQHLLFSTLEHHGLGEEPRVTVILHPPAELRVTYGRKNIWFGTPELDYLLSFEEGFATFRRFLNQLWTVTVDEPVPEELRGPKSPVHAPVLSRTDAFTKPLQWDREPMRAVVVGRPYKEVALAGRRMVSSYRRNRQARRNFRVS